MSTGCLGVSGVASPTTRPYQATPAFRPGLVRGVEPHDAAAPAEAGDAELGGVGLALALGEGDGGVEVAHDLLVRHLGDDLGDQLGDLGVALGIALAEIELGRDGVVAGLGEAPAEVGDVGVHAEDLLHHQDGAEALAGRRHGAIGRHLLAVLGLDLDLARRQPVGRRGDHGLRAHRLDRQREAAAECGAHHRRPPRQSALGERNHADRRPYPASLGLKPREPRRSRARPTITIRRYDPGRGTPGSASPSAARPCAGTRRRRRPRW